MDPVTIALGLISAAATIAEAAAKIKEASIQSGTSTPEQWAEYDAKRAAMFAQPQWQPDPEPGA
jgi:hypothetical protein